MQLSRRGFFEAAGGLVTTKLLLPEWARTSQIDLNPFTEQDKDFCHRYDMHQPFEQDGWTYATDGRIAVRTQLVMAPPAADEDKRPPASKLGWERELRWRPWPRLKTSSSDYALSCPKCDGKGRRGAGVVKCRECDGEGRGPYDCGSCCTSGFVGGFACERCHGGGAVDYVVHLGDGHIAPRYDAIVRRLDCVEYFQEPAAEVIHFRFNGGQGMLMPLHKKP